MKKITGSFLGLFLTINLIGQNISVVNVTTPGVCDGKATLDNSNHFTSWKWYKDTTLIKTGGYALSNLCIGDYKFVAIADTGLVTKGFRIASDACATLSAKIFSTYSENSVNCTGSANALVTGGTAPYNYKWYVGASVVTPSVTNLCAGAYNWVVGDAKGCSINGVVYIKDTIVNTNPCANFRVSVKTKITSGANACDGEAFSTVSGGTSPYSYKWYVAQGIKTTADVSNLCTGFYLLEVKDAKGCQDSASLVIRDNPCTDEPTRVHIYGNGLVAGCNGAMGAHVYDNMYAPYTYQWSNGYLTDSIYNLCPGVYNVAVTDNRGCLGSAERYVYLDSNIVGSPLRISVNTTDVSKTGVCDGTARFFVSGGKAPYTYSLSSGQSSDFVNNLCEGYNSATVIDALGAKASIDFVIATPLTYYRDSISLKPKGSLVIATVFDQAKENCDVNYTAIDSVRIKNYQFLGTDSILVNWGVYAENKVVTIIRAYAISAQGNYNFVLQLFCRNKGMRSNSNSTNTSGFLKAIDQVFINKTTTGFSNGSTDATSTLVFPLPFTDNLNIKLGNQQEYQISLFDMLGKLVLSPVNFIGNSTQTILLSNLPAGWYTLKIGSASGNENVKVIKR